MKKALFVAFAATVALFATSCKPKGDAPKASFSYEVEDLTVTFTNISKDATTYAWEFGDGETSTEANPVHTYAENGEYTVTLTASNEVGQSSYSEEIVLATAAIKIDGEFADWAKLEADGKCQIAKLEAGKEYEKDQLYKMAWYTDADFIYMYFEYNATETYPLDVLIGTAMIDDGDLHATHLWNPCYVDYDLEFGSEDPEDWTKWERNILYNFDHEAGGWNFPTVAAENPVTLAKTADGKMEGRMSRAYFTFKEAYFTVGAFNSNEGWGEIGTLPAAELVEGVVEYPEMLKVMLN